MRTTFIKTLAELAESNGNIWLLCGDLGYSVLEPFAARFPDRYVNIGVAEQNMAGIAAGLALSGKTVFIYSIGNFPTLRCLEQLRNDVCYHAADVKIVAVGAGYAYGSQGYTHHALEDVAILSALPGMEIFVPCDPVEARACTRQIAASGRPSYLRLSRAGEPVLSSVETKNVYRPSVLRAGRHVLVLSTGPIASLCLEAAEDLQRQGFSATVVSVACLKPLDSDFIRDAAGEHPLVVTVEEHIARGGLYAAVLEGLANHPHAPILALNIEEQYGKTSVAGEREMLLKRAGLSATEITARLKNTLENRGIHPGDD